MFLLINLLFLTCSTCWSESVQLKWSDFQGQPYITVKTTFNTSADALSAINYIITPKVDENGQIDFSVLNCFNRSKSWTTHTLSVELLQHEQLHFDISELYARKIRKAIAVLRARNEREFHEFYSVIDSLLEQRIATQSKYDIETGHGGVDFVQVEWTTKIKDELSSLKDYSFLSKECFCDEMQQSIQKNN